jgi:peptide/nickel transport system substrate-binding protein
MKYAFDPARARALLAEAGFDEGKLKFTLITQAGFAVRESVAQVLQKQFRDVGVDMSIALHDGTTISSVWFEGKFDAMLHWWQMPADPELTLFFASDRTPPQGRNINYVSDEALTKLLYASDRTVDQAERKRLLEQAQQRIAELIPELPLYSITKLDAIPSGLKGFTGNPSNAGIFWNVQDWRF